MTTLLILGASPRRSPGLHLDAEHGKITGSLLASIHGSRWATPAQLDVHIADLEGYLRAYQPDLVHVSVHGNEGSELLFLDPLDDPVPVEVKAFADLLSRHAPKIRVVVLAACNSLAHAEAIAQSIDCAVGVAGTIRESSAMAFDEGFYAALGAGESVREAFAAGRSRVEIACPPDAEALHLCARAGVSAADIHFAGGAPRGWFQGRFQTAAEPIPGFTGREVELASLRAQLAPEGNVGCVVVTGIGGVGKASLVHQFVATEADRAFPGGAVWLHGPTLPEDLPKVAVRFGWSGKDPPKPRDAITWLSQTLLAWRVLFVVESADLADVDLLPLLGGEARAVLTSERTTLADDLGRRAGSIAVPYWTLAEGRAYLRASVPRLEAAPDEALDALTEAVSGFPLAMRLIVRMLNRRGPKPTLEEVSNELGVSGPTSVDDFAVGLDRGVRTTFEVSMGRLDDEQRRVLIALAAAARATTADTVARVAERPDVRKVEEALTDLLERSLCDYNEGDPRPWSMHGVLRAYLAEQPGFAEARQRQARYVLARIEEKIDVSIDDAEVAVAIDSLLAAGSGAEAGSLLKRLSPTFLTRGRYGELAAWGERLIPLLPSGPDLAATHALVARAHGSMGDSRASITHGEAALALEVASGDRKGQAITEKDLGLAYKNLGDLGSAIAHLKIASDLGKELGDRDLAWKNLTALGLCYKALGDLDAAFHHQEEALAIAREIGSLPGQALCLTNLGICHQRRGDLEQATSAHRAALDLGTSLGDRRIQATARGNLAECRLLAGDAPGAVEDGNQALALAGAVGAKDMAAEILATLSDARRLSGDLESARDLGSRALSLAQRTSSRKIEAWSLASLGATTLALGDAAAALDLVKRAQEAADRAGDPEIQAMARAALARQHRSTGDLDAARAEFNTALDCLQKMGAGADHPEKKRLTGELDALRG